MEFKALKIKVSERIELLSKTGLYTTNIDPDVLWNTYLDSFPEGTNEIYRERREYDCSCCRHFIKHYGSLVSIVDGKMSSIWEFEIGFPFTPVVAALAELMKSVEIVNVFKIKESHMGTDFSREQSDGGEVITWQHFHAITPANCLHRGDIPAFLNDFRTGKEVFQRGLEEITKDAVTTALELITENQLYRGQEYFDLVGKFAVERVKYHQSSDKDLYAWQRAAQVPPAVQRIRNSAIGTLLVDLSGGMEVDDAVRRFETVMAPQNYRRPTAIVTKATLAKAKAAIDELGFGNSLQRRFAVKDDITVNNILFTDRGALTADVFAELEQDIAVNPRKLKAQEIKANDFFTEILPTAHNVAVLMEPCHRTNLFSLIAPQDPEAPSMFKWDNPFSWTYAGDVTDSIKERVKAAGGRVDGVLRFSIQWNDGDNNQNDFDAHCIEPNGNRIYFARPQSGNTRGNLDVDIRRPGNKVAVENITWPEERYMLEGRYQFLVHNFSHNGGRTGFTAEIEYAGQITSFTYDKELRDNAKVTVAEVAYSRANGIKISSNLATGEQFVSETTWGVPSYKFVKASMIMLSPNFWNGKPVGNLHHLFVIEDCSNPTTPRGFFNEYLKPELTEHKRVFETLAGKLTVPESLEQLSGLGFSSTKPAHLFVKVTTAADSRVYKIIF